MKLFPLMVCVNVCSFFFGSFWQVLSLLTVCLGLTWGNSGGECEYTTEKYEEATKHLKSTTDKRADVTVKADRAPWTSELIQVLEIWGILTSSLIRI